VDDPLLNDLPRGAHERHGKSQNARFTPTKQIAASSALRYAPGKHFLGLVDAKIEENPQPSGRNDRFCTGGIPIGYDTDMHVVTIAGSRGGKSRAAILNNLAKNPSSFLAVDPKGELASKTWRDRKALGQQCFVMDPFGIAENGAQDLRRAFNPVEALSDPLNETIVEDAALIADAIVVPEEGGKHAHWDETARMFIEGLILHVATATEYEGNRNLVTVYQLLARADQALREEMEINFAGGGAVMDAAASFFQKPDTERESVLSTARRHARFLGYPQMQAVLSGPSIDLKELKTKATTIYLCLPAMRLGACSRWLRLFINATLASMEAERTIPKLPVVLCLDEFAILGHMKTIEDAAGQIAGLGCRLWPILQDLGQLKALYKDRWETFLGNAGVIQLFANSDLTTLEWVSKRLGQTTVRTISGRETTSTEWAKEGLSGTSTGVVTEPLMAPEEIARFFSRDDPLLRQLVIIAGYPPLILQRAFYDKHELFTGKKENDQRSLGTSSGDAGKAAPARGLVPNFRPRHK
jgi:type IV secretion system protein VirD4